MVTRAVMSCHMKAWSRGSGVMPAESSLIITVTELPGKGMVLDV